MIFSAAERLYKGRKQILHIKKEKETLNMRGKISFPYIPLKTALYSDKVDRLGYIYGDKKTGEGLTYEEYDKRLRENYNDFNTIFNGGYGCLFKSISKVN